jgi:cytochrome c oxidase subunit 4
MTDTATQPSPSDEHPLPAEERAHPSEWRYIQIAIALAIVTAAEVAVYYLKFAKLTMVIVLLVMAVVKFSLVAAFFMHLRFDSRLFRRVFITGIALAIGVYTIVLLSFGVFLTNRHVTPHVNVPSPTASQ